MNVLFLSISTIMMMAKRKGYDILFQENYRKRYGRLFFAFGDDANFFFYFIFLGSVIPYFSFNLSVLYTIHGIPMDKNVYMYMVEDRSV